MDKDRIISIIDYEIEHASGANDSELSDKRSRAIEYYKGEAVGKLAPKGNKSAVVDTVLADSIEWMLPQLLDTFVGGEEVLRFDSMGSEDEQQASDESDAVNYVVTKTNPPYTIWNTAFRDALLGGNCVTKVYWDDTKSTSQESYQNLSLQEFQMLINDDDVEVLEQEEIEPDETMMLQQQAMGMPPTPFFNVRLMRTERGICIDNIPLDNFRYSDDINNTEELHKARFVSHDTLRTVSDLIEDGFDRAQVEGLPSYDNEDDEEDYAREMGDWDNDDEDGNSDPSSRRIRVHEVYLRIDNNDDGVQELYQIYYAGKQILSMEEADTIPFVMGAAIPQPHVPEGLSLYDRLKDVMEQKTVTWRQVLDNMYQVNNTRHVAVRGKVNLDDLLNNRIGGVIRANDVNNPAEAVMPLPVQPMFQHGYQMLEYLDRISEARSGVGANFMGQNQALTGDTAHGIERVMSAGEMLVGNIKRALGETIVKGTYLLVHELLQKYQEQEMTIPSKDDAIVVHPASWKKRDKTTIKVGLGTGDRMKQQAAMQQVLMFQEKLAVAGRDDMVTPQKVFNALEDFAGYAGLQDVAQYFVDPSSQEGQQIAAQKAQQQPPPDPNMMLLEVENKKADAQVMKNQADAETKQADQQLKMQELQMKQLEMQIKERELAIKEQELSIKQAEIAGSQNIDRYKIDTDAAIEEAKLQKEREDTIIELQKERERLQADLERQSAETTRIKSERDSAAVSKAETPSVPEIHIHNGGKKRVVVNRTANGLEGTSESIDEE